MTSADSTGRPCGDSARHSPPPRARPCLLLVEPEGLLRWSLTTYLGQWFDVFPTETTVAADRILGQHRIDAVITSEELPEGDLAEVERRALACNSSARIVRTVTGLSNTCAPLAGTFCIEKPFELSKLAKLLGIHPRCASESNAE